MYSPYKSVLGVDPGASGGFACWRDDKSFTAFGMPATEGDQLELIRELIAPGETIVEQVGGFTGHLAAISDLSWAPSRRSAYASNSYGRRTGKNLSAWEQRLNAQAGPSGKTS